MRYARARYQQHQRDWAYRFYLAECSRIMANNTANLGGGTTLSTSLYDLIHPRNEDDRDGEEIAQEFLRKFRGD